MIDLADAVTAVLAHDGKALTLGHGLDGMAYIAQRGPGFDGADAGHQGFIGGVDQAPGQIAGLAHVVHAAGVADPAFGRGHCDVDIDDVAVLEDLLDIGDAVADHMVDGGAHGLGKTVIAHIGGRAFQLVDDVVVTDLVQFLGAYAGLYMGREHGQHLGGQAAGLAREIDVGGVMNGHDFLFAALHCMPPTRRTGRGRRTTVSASWALAGCSSRSACCSSRAQMPS